ncbi:MAG: DUF2029 domain-containing protein [Anaerolineae bacterium]|nr:DUF2029 domain-containing protein [Anaerolineae bacterium]
MRNRRLLLLVMLLLGLVVSGCARPASLMAARWLADDYVEYWAAGRLNLTGGNPYAADQLLPLERAAGRTAEVLMMWNPPYTLALAMPLALADYPLSRLFWLLLNIVAVMVATSWWWRLSGGPPRYWWVAQVVAFTFFPTVTALRMGQIGPLILLGVVGLVRYARERRDGLAGAFLALVAIKPHLLYLIWPALLLWTAQTRRWRILAGTTLALAAATAAALIANPGVIGQYLAATAADSPLIWATPTFGSLLRLLFGFDRRWLQFVPLLPGLSWLLIYWRRHGANWQWADHMPLLLLVSVVTTAFGWSFDQVVLLPAVLDVVRHTLVAPVAQDGGLRHGSHAQARGWCYVGYVAINIAAWALYGRVSDFWQIWLAPALLIWHRSACIRQAKDAIRSALSDR